MQLELRAPWRESIDPNEFRRLCDEAKGTRDLSAVVSMWTKLRPRGKSEMVGLCPFHEERSPSLEVNNAKGLFHCHGCGASGDHFTALRKLGGMTFRQAFEVLTDGTFPIVSEVERAKRKADDAAAMARRRRQGVSVWQSAVPIAGTLAETYLRFRGITMDIPETVRFARLPYFDQETRERLADDLPALVCALQDGAGDLVGVQRIYLAPDGLGKADVPKAKLSLGVIVGSAFRASGWHYSGAASVVVCEGAPDALTLAQGLPGQQVWAACGTGLMPRVEFPAGVSEAVLAGDNDAAGRNAVDACRHAFTGRGLAVRAMFPAVGFKDWNDELQGKRA